MGTLGLNGKLGNREQSEDSRARTGKEDAGDRLPSLPAWPSSGFCPAGSRFSPLVGNCLPFSLLPFFSHAPRIGSVESPVVDLQGSPSTTIHDQTWNPPPPWAGPLHLAEERVLPKVSRRLSAS